MRTQPAARTPDRYKGLLIVPTAVALWFLDSFAFRYFTVDRDRFGIYWPRHEWLYVHIVAGTLALLLGPLQFWLGLNRREMLMHRVLGIAYLLSVFVSAGGALYLARHTDFGWVFGTGLTAMAVAWMISTSFAAVAILRHMLEQHREWIIRSYVLTFGFVTFRLFIEVMQMVGVGTTMEQVTAASWLSWSVPLLITEWVIQGRKIFARQDSLTQDSLIHDSVTHDWPVNQDSLTQDSVIQDSVIQDSVIQDSLTQDSLTQDSLTIEAADHKSEQLEMFDEVCS